MKLKALDALAAAGIPWRAVFTWLGVAVVVAWLAGFFAGLMVRVLTGSGW